MVRIGKRPITVTGDEEMVNVKIWVKQRGWKIYFNNFIVYCLNERKECRKSGVFLESRNLGGVYRISFRFKVLFSKDSERVTLTDSKGYNTTRVNNVVRLLAPLPLPPTYLNSTC